MEPSSTVFYPFCPFSVFNIIASFTFMSAPKSKAQSSHLSLKSFLKGNNTFDKTLHYQKYTGQITQTVRLKYFSILFQIIIFIALFLVIITFIHLLWRNTTNHRPIAGLRQKMIWNFGKRNGDAILWQFHVTM